MSDRLTTSTTIRRVRYDEILGAPNAEALIAEYGVECALSDYDPQTEIYAAMEKAGVLQCFGAYVADELVGFVSVLFCVMPHNGKRVATIESLFVQSTSRDSGAGNDLLSAAEEYVTASGCSVFTYTCRIGSRLETVLSRRAGCKATHTVFSRWL